MTIMELNDRSDQARRAHDRKNELDKKISNIAAAAKQMAEKDMDKDARKKLHNDILNDMGIVCQIVNEMSGACYEYYRLLSDIARASEISWPPTVKSLAGKAGS